MVNYKINPLIVSIIAVISWVCAFVYGRQNNIGDFYEKAITLCLVCGLFLIFVLLLLEKRADNNFRKKQDVLSNDDLFGNNQKYEKYLKYAQKYGFSRKHGKCMKADIRYFYASRNTIILFFLGILFVVMSFDASNIMIFKRVCVLAFGGAFVWFSLNRMIMAKPIRKLYKEMENQGITDELFNDDYMAGKLLVNKNTSLNIGVNYSVYCNDENIIIFANNDIVLLKRYMQYRKTFSGYGTFSGSNYDYKLEIDLQKGIIVQTGCELKFISLVLDEFQIDMAFDVYRKIGIRVLQEYTSQHGEDIF